MASNTAPAPAADDELLHEFGPLLRVYKSGRLERPLVLPPVAPGLDPSTGVQSKDVDLGAYSARLYLPPTAATTTAKLPVIVYVHGGGFVAESAKSPNYHRFLNDLASACPALGVSLDYRLAPEHPLPAAYDDCLDALRWVLSAADPWVAAHGSGWTRSGPVRSLIEPPFGPAAGGPDRTGPTSLAGLFSRTGPAAAKPGPDRADRPATSGDDLDGCNGKVGDVRRYCGEVGERRRRGGRRAMRTALGGAAVSHYFLCALMLLP